MNSVKSFLAFTTPTLEKTISHFKSNNSISKPWEIKDSEGTLRILTIISFLDRLLELLNSQFLSINNLIIN